MKQQKIDKLALSVAQDFAHANSATINSRRRVLQFEAEEIDKSLVALAATVTNLKARRAKIASMLAGLAEVIGRR
jgi:hypothetical protein